MIIFKIIEGKVKMKQLININVGLDKIAKIYVEQKGIIDSEPVVYDRCGTNKTIKLYRYRLKDGSTAEEYLQIFMENKSGQKLYFLGLRTSKRDFDWPSAKILKLLNKKF